MKIKGTQIKIEMKIKGTQRRNMYNANKQFRTKRGKYCSNNKLAEQSAKISKLEHKATEQGWTTKNYMLK